MNRLSIGVSLLTNKSFGAPREHTPRVKLKRRSSWLRHADAKTSMWIYYRLSRSGREMLAHHAESLRGHSTGSRYRLFLPRRSGTVMADQITLAIGRHHSRKRSFRAATQASRTLIDNGYVEYMPMYFTFQGLKPFGGERYYFGLRGDYFGFGMVRCR